MTYLGSRKQESEIQANEKKEKDQIPGQSNEANERARASGHWICLALQRGAQSKFRKILISQRGETKADLSHIPSCLVPHRPLYHPTITPSSLPCLCISVQSPYLRTKKTSQCILSHHLLPLLSLFTPARWKQFQICTCNMLVHASILPPEPLFDEFSHMLGIVPSTQCELLI